MNTYNITFISRMRLTLREEFVIAAVSRNQAVASAEALLSSSGKRVAHYQRPKVERRVA